MVFVLAAIVGSGLSEFLARGPTDRRPLRRDGGALLADRSAPPRCGPPLHLSLRLSLSLSLRITRPEDHATSGVTPY